MEQLAIGTDKHLQLARDIHKKWQEAQKLAAPVNWTELSTEEGMVLDDAVHNQLHLQRNPAEKKKDGAWEARAQKILSQCLGKTTQKRKVSVYFEESVGSTIAEASPDESQCNIEDWESDLEALVEPDSA